MQIGVSCGMRVNPIEAKMKYQIKNNFIYIQTIENNLNDHKWKTLVLFEAFVSYIFSIQKSIDDKNIICEDIK